VRAVHRERAGRPPLVVRNVERKTDFFFATDLAPEVYPDFVCQLDDERILVVEYKGSHLYDAPEQKEKREIGELWARRSRNRCLFVMPQHQDFASIARIANTS
jgi:type III restriction enzyme